MVVEGSQAGGHLGFHEDELLEGRCPTLEEILPGVLAEVRPYEEKYGRPIPVFAAGGVFTGQDMAGTPGWGQRGSSWPPASSPLMSATPPRASRTCCSRPGEEDLAIIHSPVGMPGRAVRTPLIQRLEQGLRFPPKHCSLCMAGCQPAQVPFCITHALIQAVKGNWEEGLFFSGSNVGKLDRMLHVRELMDELMKDWRAFA